MWVVDDDLRARITDTAQLEAIAEFLDRATCFAREQSQLLRAQSRSGRTHAPIRSTGVTDDDAQDYGDCFTADSGYVSFDGTRAIGRAPMVDAHDRLLSGSSLVGQVESIRYLGTDVAVVHATGSVGLELAECAEVGVMLSARPGRVQAVAAAGSSSSQVLFEAWTQHEVVQSPLGLNRGVAVGRERPGFDDSVDDEVATGGVADCGASANLDDDLVLWCASGRKGRMPPRTM